MKLPTTLIGIPGANDGLLEPLLDQVGVDVVGGAGGATAEPQVAVVVKVEVGVAEEVAVALEHVEQLFGRVLVHRLDLRRHVVVHDEERYLQDEHVGQSVPRIVSTTVTGRYNKLSKRCPRSVTDRMSEKSILGTEAYF